MTVIRCARCGDAENGPWGFVRGVLMCENCEDEEEVLGCGPILPPPPAPPTSPAPPIDDFEAFTAAVQARLDRGKRSYGDASFSRTPAALLRELQEEALDLAGWGYVLWRRLDTALAALREGRDLTLALDERESPTSLQGIAAAVARYYGFAASDLRSECRSRSMTLARHVAFYWCIRAGHSRSETGGYFGFRTHSTVAAGVERIARLRRTSPGLQRELSDLGVPQGETPEHQSSTGPK